MIYNFILLEFVHSEFMESIFELNFRNIRIPQGHANILNVYVKLLLSIIL